MDKPHMIDGGIAHDDRGHVAFCNDFSFSGVKRFYMISNREKNFIRAWHGHKREAKYLLATQGVFRIGAVHLETEETVVKYLNGDSPSVLYIPAGWANGIQNLTEENNLMIFSTSTIEESLGDDTRFPWDKWDIWNTEDYR